MNMGELGKLQKEDPFNIKVLVGKEQELWDVIVDEWDNEDFILGVKIMKISV